MSRCAETGPLLDAVFAEIDLTRDQVTHLATCAECARALALLRRFDADLEAIGRDLAPERVGSAHDLIEVSIPKEGSTVSWRNGFIGVAAVAVVLLAVAFASVLGEMSIGSDDRSEAAAAFGIREDAVVMVGGDALGLRVGGDGVSARLELLLIEAEDRRVRQIYEARLDIRPDSSGIFTQPVRCFGLLERDLYAVVAVGWPAGREQVDIAGASGELAAFEARGRGEEATVAVLFVARADEVEEGSMLRLRIGPATRIGGRAGGGQSTGTLGHEAVACAQPATARCGDWPEWSAGTRASITQWLTETRLEAVRISQQLRANATEVDIVDAAASSIDKNCQGSPPERLLREIVEQLYD